MLVLCPKESNLTLLTVGMDELFLLALMLPSWTILHGFSLCPVGVDWVGEGAPISSCSAIVT